MDDIDLSLESESFSLQSALNVHSVCPTSVTQSFLDAKLVSLCRKMQQTYPEPVSLPDIPSHPSQCAMVASTLCELNPLCLSQQTSLASTMELGFGLALATSCTTAAVKAKMSSLTSKDSIAPDISSVSNGESGSEQSAGNRRKNPFSSAKDRYEDEGGKFERFRRPQAAGQLQAHSGNSKSDSEALPAELAHCDRMLVERIEAEIVHQGQVVTFDAIAGLKFAKETVIELICWPMTQPELFQGLRALPRGVLLFGPPGTGKTLIGKAIAHQSGATFFSISASSLMSKWIGEGEKTVKALFAVAAFRQPSVIFVDEVDSLLCQRSSDENEATRRMKTEFMVQLDGASTNADARVIIIGATNRPEELDEAVRRRFVKRIYIPLPDEESRAELLDTLLKDVRHGLDQSHLQRLVEQTDGFSGADIRSLCTEAAMGPVREVALKRQGNLQNVQSKDIPAITMEHFLRAFAAVKPSVSPGDLQRYIDWNNTFGSYRASEST